MRGYVNTDKIAVQILRINKNRHILYGVEFIHVSEVSDVKQLNALITREYRT